MLRSISLVLNYQNCLSEQNVPLRLAFGFFAYDADCGQEGQCCSAHSYSMRSGAVRAVDILWILFFSTVNSNGDDTE